jgi:hypothetical protein
LLPDTPDLIHTGGSAAPINEPEWVEESVWELGQVTTVGSYTSHYWRERAVKINKHPLGFSTSS